MSEKKFDAQVNYGWGLTLNMTGKAPAINKRIFDTLSDAQSFADDYNDSAIEGLVLSVVADDNKKNNGIYFVERIKKSADGESSILIKVGSNEEELNLIREDLNKEIENRENSNNALQKSFQEDLNNINGLINDNKILIEENKNIIDSYTVNNKKISENPILESDDIKISESYSIIENSNKNLSNLISPNDTVTSAINKLESSLEDTTLTFSTAINDLEEKTNIFIEVTYDELKMLRDNNQLIVGKWYRIIDYETIIYNNEYNNAQSANNLFDIIVLAIDTNKLSENAKAINSKRDIDGYFQNSNLSAWELKYSLDNDWTKFSWVVPDYDKYDQYYTDGTIETSDIFLISSNDNKIEGYSYKLLSYLYGNYPSMIYLPYLNIKEGEDKIIGYTEGKFGTVTQIEFEFSFIKSENQIKRSKGVIYEMKDEFNNKCFYDFKNIQFRRYKIKGIKEDASKDDFKYYNEYILPKIDNHPELPHGYNIVLPNGYNIDNDDFKYFYTFSLIINDNIKDSSLGFFIDSGISNEQIYGGGTIKNVNSNIINNFNLRTDEFSYTFNIPDHMLSDNVFISYFDNFTYLIQNNILNNNCFGNTFISNVTDNILDSNAYGNILDSSNSNRIGYGFQENWMISSDNNIIFNECGINNFSEITGSTFGNNCRLNNIKKCNYNSFGNSIFAVKMELCDYNTFGNSINNVEIGKNSHYNTIHSGVKQTTINSGTTYQQIFPKEYIIQIPTYLEDEELNNNNNN